MYGFDKLISDYLGLKISSAKFEILYREKFLNDLADASEDVFLILDELYVFVYGYTKDKELLQKYPESHFDDNQLTVAAAKALRQLQELSSEDRKHKDE